ncbi:FMN-binding negative transcriptional regulator [Tenacibaculum jejuense]|uniref:Putative Protease synthase and sporulation protein PAI 2 n=1 Tax=Tenacibaculum jejuense TaxID=584609 RepID=A0A238U650_9FLAO|nr:FMN-binding negative transcriptional regulator [Tenacibaculum jejuense]SNR13964.1 putative Protease synthase and sporulation protein PAI 2 [Tenacibaculum jejuense]
MYNVSSYKAKNEQEILDFIKEYPFVQITGVNEKGKPVATQIPVIVEKRNDDLYIVGHMMKETDHCKAFQENPNVLSVFTGPNGYVSASWCVSPNKGSTWNYMSVHAEGKVSFFEGEKLVSLMKTFTLLHENGNENSPTIYDNLSDSYTNKWMPYITGFEIKVDCLDTVFKLSQSLDEQSYLNVIAELEKRGGRDSFLAMEMQKRVSELFSE